MNTADQYLKAVYVAERVDGGRASTSTLADLLDVSPASATEMIGKLEEQGLVDHEKYKGATLTEAGTERAEEAIETYCILQRFLRNVLGVEEYRAEAQALESVIDETVAERLDTIIDRPAECPACFDVHNDACSHLSEQETEEVEAGAE